LIRSQTLYPAELRAHIAASISYSVGLFSATLFSLSAGAPENHFCGGPLAAVSAPMHTEFVEYAAMSLNVNKEEEIQP
jgi:hypothetical protein